MTVIMRNFFVLSLVLLGINSFAQKKPTVKMDTISVTADSLQMIAKPVVIEEEDTLSYAEEYRRDAFQFSWGLRGAIAQGRISTPEDNVIRVSPNGTPLLTNGKVVRDKLVSNTGFIPALQGALFIRLIRGSFYFQPELAYSQKGGKFDFLNTDGNLVDRVNARFTTVDVPVLFGLRFRNARVFAGPVTSFALSMDDEFANSLKPYTNEALSAEFFKRPILNGLFGIGFEFGSFFFDVRYEGGFGQYVDRTIGPGSNSTPFNFKSDQIQLSVGLIR